VAVGDVQQVQVRGKTITGVWSTCVQYWNDCPWIIDDPTAACGGDCPQCRREMCPQKTRPVV